MPSPPAPFPRESPEYEAMFHHVVYQLAMHGGWISGVQVDRMLAEIAELQAQVRWLRRQVGLPDKR